MVNFLRALYLAAIIFNSIGQATTPPPQQSCASNLWSHVHHVEMKDEREQQMNYSSPYIFQLKKSLSNAILSTYSNLSSLADDLGFWKMKTYMSTSNLLVKNYNTKAKAMTLAKILRLAKINYYNMIPRTNALFATTLAPHLLQMSNKVLFHHQQHTKSIIPPILRVTAQRGIKWAAHYDGHQNHVLQVLGSKIWLLFPPEMATFLDLFPLGHPSERHSILDFAEPQEEHLEHLIAKYGKKAVLTPGDILYVPPKWIHFTISITDETISINWFTRRE